MVNYPKNVALKGGQEVTIRPLEAGDKSALQQFYDGLPEEDRQYLRRDVAEDKLLNSLISENRKAPPAWLIVSHDDRIIGEGSLYHPPKGWRRKVGEMRLIIDPTFQHQGLGSIIARELFKSGVQLGLDKICVSVLEEKSDALRCVEKLGFKSEGVLKNYIIDNQDRLHNMVFLCLDI